MPNHKSDQSPTRSNPWEGRIVLITGACGTVGRELLKQVTAQNPKEVIGIDNNETEVFFLSESYRAAGNVKIYLGDVRDRHKLMQMTEGVEIVLHTAALKHVILCERAPRDALLTNIAGVQNIVDAAVTNRVARVIFTSSDKAVNPTNVMGTSKLMGERLITAANALRRTDGQIFASTRFGNILGSRGSVLPIFHQQIANGGPLTLTDPAMTRFIMTLDEAVRLVMDSVFLARGGEVFVTKMPIARIADIAEVMIEELAPRYGKRAKDIDIKIIGSKPGEKRYEELMSDEETRRTVELDRYFSVTPAFKTEYQNIDYTYPNQVNSQVTRAYNSSVETALEKEALRNYLLQSGLLDSRVEAERHR